MNMKTMLWAVVFCSMVQTGVTAAAQEDPLAAPAGGGELVLDAGTLQFGGVVSAQFDFGGGWDGWRFHASPEFGYFVIDHLALTTTIGVTMPSSQAYSQWLVDAAFGFQYFFAAGPVLPYVGVLAGTSIFTSRGDDGSNWYFFDLNVPVGLLFPLNERVAVDVGLRNRFSFSPGRYEISPTLCLGVQSFF